MAVKVRTSTRRIIALDITSRGFGFAVMEGPDELVDWGVKQVQPYEEARCLRHLEKLIQRYRPELLVLEDHKKKPRRRSLRVLNLIEKVTALAKLAGVPVRLVNWKRVKAAFAPNAFINKFGIARAIGRHLPELASRVPPFRKAWMSEDYRTAIFDAVALALTFYSSLKAFRKFTRDEKNETDSDTRH